MALDNAKNFAKVTVSTGYDASATSIVLSASEGAKLPSVSFNAVWYNSTDYADPSDDPNVEIVRVTARSTDTLTVTRAQESTSASTKNTGGKTYKMIAGLTAKAINTDIYTSPTFVTPALGTPASGTMTNVTGLPEGGLALTDITTNDASTSKHGFLKKLNNSATQFMNGQGNWATPSGATHLSAIPLPSIGSLAGTTGNITINTNTNQYFYQFVLPFAMTVNKISIYSGGATVNGTFDLTIYSEDGQTQEIAVTTATVSTTGIITTAVSAVTLSAGLHWFGFNSNGTANVDWSAWTSGSTTGPFSSSTGLPFAVTSEPVLAGTATITAGTPKSTFTPSSGITANNLSSVAIVFRLDN